VGLVCTPWQRFALDRLLEVNPETRALRFRDFDLSVARRNGKTTTLRALLGWLLDASPIWELAAITAPTREQSYATLFVELGADLRPLGMEAQPTGARAGIGYPDSPKRLFLLSGHHDFARGRTFDVVVLDEAQTQTLDPEVVWPALEPTTRTRRDGLVIATGTAGTDRAKLFRALYDRALLASARPADDPRYGALIWEGVTGDEDAAIREANPAVRDGLLDLDLLRATRRSLPASAYVRETLNRWTADSSHAWAPPGSWEACRDRFDPPGDVAPYFGLDVTPAWSRATISAAYLDGESVLVDVARDLGEVSEAKTDELMEEARELLRRYRRSRMGFDAASPVAAAMRDLAQEFPGRIEELGGQTFRAACAAFLGHVVAGTLRHSGHPALDSAARLAARSEEGEAWRFVRRRSAGNIDALVAATCAVYLAVRPQAPRARIR
jgi:hypothetical protein